MLSDILSDKLAKLESEIAKMQMMCAALSNTIETLDKSSQIIIDQLQIMDCEAEYFIATPLPSNVALDEKVMVEGIKEHMEYCSRSNISPYFRIGEIVLQENMEKGIFSESYYCSRIDQPISDARLLVKPKGTYAVLYHQGNYDTLYEVYKDIVSQIRKKGYSLAGNLYEEDLIDYLSESNPNNYILKIVVQVQKAN